MTVKKLKLPDQQLAFPLKQTEAGTPMEKVCRKLGVRQQAFYRPGGTGNT